MHLFLIAVSLVDIFLFSPIQPRAVDRMMAPPAVLNVAWRPTGAVLASGSFGQITDHDLFMFLHMRGAEQDDLLRCGRYFSGSGAFADTREEDAEWIQEQIADLVTVYYLASQTPAAAPAGDAELLPLLDRLLTYPAAELVWIDNEVTPKVKIDRPDIIHYYRQFESEFKKKGRYEIQVAFVPAPIGQTEVQRREIVTYLERLKASLTDASDWQEVLFQLQRRRPDILVEYRKQTLEIGAESDNTFEKNVQELVPGAFSPVFETIEGYYLIQSLKAEPPQTIPLSEAEPEIRQILHEKFIINQYNIEIARFMLKTTFQLYVDRWDFLPEDAPVLVVRDFRMDRREVERLMSHHIYLNTEVFVPALSIFATNMLNRELILHRAEKEKYWGDSRWEAGRAMAAQFMAAMRALNADYNQQHGDETPALLRRYYEMNPDLFARAKTVRLVQIIGTLRNPDSYLPSDRFYLVETMKKRLEEFVRNADDVLLTPRQTFRDAMAAGGPTATTSTLALELFDPEQFQGLVEDYNTREYRFDVRDIGYLDITGLTPLEEVLEGVRPGYFSAVGTFENTAATYYVWDTQSAGQVTFEEMIPMARQAFRTQNMGKIWKKRREEALFWGDVKWSL